MKVTKQIRKEIKDLARMLSPMADFQEKRSFGGAKEIITHKVKRGVSGQVLIDNKIVTDNKGVKIDPTKNYFYDVDFAIGVNHERRMVRAYQQGGWDAVKHYLREMDKKAEKYPQLVQKATSK